ncbi:MAG: preprotein translocase subunit SecE [Anaerolineaceae bacterium]|nr:preprotein translocase subunit SecE [Anaerolineaceae bacterium]
MAEKTGKEKKRKNGITRWWRETVGELRKVSWPTRQEAWHLTKVVIAVMVVMSAFLFSLDFIFSKIITALLV